MKIIQTYLPSIVTIENSQDIYEITSFLCNKSFAVMSSVAEKNNYPFNVKLTYDLNIRVAHMD